MIKRSALRKICISTLALVILGIICVFPDAYTPNKVEESISYTEAEKSVIYLLDKNNYVARTNVIKKNTETTKLIKEIISYLIIDSDTKDYIPGGFNSLIPKDTKILSMDLKDGLLKINFSKEFLNISLKHENAMIESIVFSLTEIDDINQIMIFVENENLTELPNSKKKLPLILDRNFGINKVYDIKSIKETCKVTSYYLAKDENNDYYYVPVTTVTNNDKEKVEIIIEQLKTAPIYQTNLISFLQANAELLDYEILENKISLSFNNYLFDDFNDKTILEEVKYAISYSISDTYGIDMVSYLVENEKIDELILT
ncbi:MAG: GerMN domain-containing protein [Bacilli bacterium]|nr:GerMN domain-containing protein [Bacilli bacterium]